MKKINIIFAIFFCFHLSVQSQSTIAIGGWQTYFNYNLGKQVECLGNDLFYASQKSLLHIDLTENMLNRMNKSSGLSDIDISCIKTIDNKYLVIAYNNSNLDIYQNGQVYNIPDIFNKQISGDKHINSIVDYQGNAFLACGFGIVCLDLKKKTIKDTWFFQNGSEQYPVLDLTFARDSIFALTESTIFKTSINNNQINNFATWQKEFVSTNNDKYLFLKSLNDVLFCVKKDSVLSFNGTDSSYNERDRLYINTNGKWEAEPTLHDWTFFFNIEIRQNKIIFFSDWGLVVKKLGEDKSLLHEIYYPCEKPISAFYKDETDFYLASQTEGLIHCFWYQNQYLGVTSPIQDVVWKMDWKKGKLSVVHGISNNMIPTYNNGKSSQYQNNKWISIEDFDQNGETFFDLIDTKIAPFDTSIVYSAALVGGLVKIQNGKVVQLYNKNNSSLQGFSENTNLTMLTALEFDLQQNLWMGNYSVNQPLSVLTKDGSWKSYSLPYGLGNAISVIFCDSRGWLWITNDKGKTLMIFNHNNTPLLNTDDYWVNLNTSLAEQDGPFTTVNTITEDKNGKIWLGTDAGIKYYSSPSKLFDAPNTLPNSVVVNRITKTDTLAEVVLKSEFIHSICVDGGNRKWIATDNAGVFLLSEDAKTEIFHFTTENSPLLSNTVLDIAIDGNSGEVFFATDKGLISFRYTATDTRENLENIKIFPNPVKPNFNGYIAISELMENAEVKITDARGALVYRTTANGGTAVWDGRRFDGTKVASGVYFVFVAAGENLKYKKAGKILFLK